ncbi:MAG: hypothetical protein JXA28_08370 [Bacteroidetes bacterium]|nr:hypothetical protein [Bacteroidota bacterium]
MRPAFPLPRPRRVLSFRWNAAAILCFLPALLTAQEVDFSGFGATGVRMYDRNPLTEFNQEFYYEGKFQADIELSKDIEGQLDFRGKSDDRAVILREFSVKFEYMNYARIKVGNIKKPYSIEGLADRDEYIPVFDSYIHRRNEELGYAGRNVGLMVYHNFNPEKRPDMPWSYAVGVFKNQSYVTSAYARGTYHFDSWYVSLGYAVLSRSHDDAITTHGVSADAGFRSKRFETGIELFAAQDPEEGIRRRLLDLSDRVLTAGLRSLTALRFDVDGKVVEMIEPFVLIALYAPDADATEYHTLEIMPGVNVFVDDDVRLRLTADGLLTKDRFSDEYGTHGSVFAAEVFVKF